ncbi:MAG: glycoside hydrolase family 5 protein [Methylococcaceae bacterium]|jgi:glucan 1,3-beta-glucosidase
MHPTLNQSKAKKLRGVNLGGWLVLEKWMTPSLFKGLAAVDETTFCVELGTLAESILTKHWDCFITQSDFEWLANIGINAVRIPVGHWLFGGGYPSHPSYGDNLCPYVEGGVEVLDKAFNWAEYYGLHIVLDLHAAPGCQNGFDNGGIKDVCDWQKRPEYIEYTLYILERLAERYHTSPALHAIETLNEPRWDIETDILKAFHTEAYHRIRRYCQPHDVAVVVHDGFRSYQKYLGFLQEPAFSNVIFDIHRYQCFVPEDTDMDIYGHIQKSAIDWKQEADEVIKNFDLPVYIGEWSLGLDLKFVELWADGPFNHGLETMDEFQQTLANRAYAAAQLLSFEKYLGWFFWSYKTETMPGWSFRDAVFKGWLPAKF